MEAFDRSVAGIRKMRSRADAAGLELRAWVQDIDLAPHIRGPFAEGEVLELYDGWLVDTWEAYTLDDEHPGGVRHRHAINKIVARKPT